jgi:nucleoside recognition membrane protein YjiH
MFKKSFLLGLAMSSIFLVSLTISSFTISASPLSRGMTGSLYQRNGSVHFSNTYRLDCFRRTYNFNHEKSSVTEQKDVSNYFINLS